MQAHRVQRFKLSPDPKFFLKLRDIVGLYLHPPEKALVLSVDEKSQIQALDRTQPILPLRPRIERRVPRRLAVHLILDNYGTHTHPAVEA